jgi:arsenical pump membrane protein
MLRLAGVPLVVAAALAFAGTLGLVLVRPRNLSIGVSALAGAALCVALGIVVPHDLLSVFDIVWNPTLTFVAVVVISLVLDAAGFFTWSALVMLRRACGSAPRAFVYLLLLGAVVAALFTNDGAALILTPIVYQQIKALRFGRDAAFGFVMAAGFIADTTSLPLVVSNLVNILDADYFHIGFARYAMIMVPVDLVSLAASIGVLWLMYRRAIPQRYDVALLAAPRTAIVDHRLFQAAWAGLAILLIGYLLSGPLGYPVAVPALIVAAALLVMGGARQVVAIGQTLRDAPWRIIVFAIGMYVVVYGLQHARLVGYLARWLALCAHQGLVIGTVGTGVTIAVVSAIANNLPTTLVGALAVAGSGATGATHLGLVLANAVGADLGPKFTPIGSLATLLWLHVLAERGISIGWRRYLRQGLLLTLPVLLVTLLALAGMVAFVR